MINGELQMVYWIQSSVRAVPTTGCPDYSWLSWNDNTCQQVLDTGVISNFGKLDQVSHT